MESSEKTNQVKFASMLGKLFPNAQIQIEIKPKSTRARSSTDEFLYLYAKESNEPLVLSAKMLRNDYGIELPDLKGQLRQESGEQVFPINVRTADRGQLQYIPSHPEQTEGLSNESPLPMFTEPEEIEKTDMRGEDPPSVPSHPDRAEESFQNPVPETFLEQSDEVPQSPEQSEKIPSKHTLSGNVGRTEQASHPSSDLSGDNSRKRAHETFLAPDADLNKEDLSQPAPPQAQRYKYARITSDSEAYKDFKKKKETDLADGFQTLKVNRASGKWGGPPSPSR